MKMLSKQVNKERKKPLNKKTIFSFLIVLVITIFVFRQFSKGIDVSNLLSLLREVDRQNMWYAVICFLLYFFITPLSLHLLCHQNHFHTSWRDHFLIASSEHFFCNITPFSSGGQPMLIYLFHQKQVSPRRSIGIIIANFIALMISSNLFAVCSLLFFDDFSYNFSSSTIWVIALGFLLNLMTLFFLTFLAPSQIARNVMNRIFAKLCKIKWVGRFLGKYVHTFDDYCGNIQEAIRHIFAHKLTFTSCVLLRITALLCYYSIPYFLLRALGVGMKASDLPYIILATSFAITAMIWLPTPGGTGGVEFAFITIFSSFIGVTADVSVAQTILWRGMTYYVLIVLGFLCYITYELLLKRWKSRALSTTLAPMMEVSEELLPEEKQKSE